MHLDRAARFRWIPLFLASIALLGGCALGSVERAAHRATGPSVGAISAGTQTVAATTDTAFVSASGDITCALDAVDGVWCHVADPLWEIAEPAACNGRDYGEVVEVTSLGGGFGCYTDVFWEIDAEPLADGAIATAGPFSCSVERARVTCLDGDSRGFSLSRLSVNLLGEPSPGSIPSHDDLNES